jgi:hypothetical protein
VNVQQGNSKRPAKLQERVLQDAAVQTGMKSRAELMFSDQTLTRLGANTVFTFSRGTRDMILDQGTMMLSVPKGAGGAKISTAAVSAAVTGTTILVECDPPKTQGAEGDDLGFTKWIVVEGELRVYINNRIGESRIVKPGQMIILPPNAKRVPPPVDIDLERLVKTSHLFKDGFHHFKNVREILEALEAQRKDFAKKRLIPTNLVIVGNGTEMVLANDGFLGELDQAMDARNVEQLLTNKPVPRPVQIPIQPLPLPGPSPVPAPHQPVGKAGPVQIHPAVFAVRGDTQIVTDPTITTPSQSPDIFAGTIYNSQRQGAASEYLYGGGKPADEALDSLAGQAGDMTVFGFDAYLLEDTPVSIDTTNGPTKLMLYGVNGISSEAADATISFPGITDLYLVSSDGNVDLGSATNFDMMGGNLSIIAGQDANISSSVAANTLSVAGYNVNVDAEIPLDVSSAFFFAADHFGTLTANTFNIDMLAHLVIDGGTIALGGNLDFSQTASAHLQARYGSLSNAYDNGEGFDYYDLLGFDSLTAYGWVRGQKISADDINAGYGIEAADSLAQKTAEKSLLPSQVVGSWTTSGGVSAGTAIIAPNVIINAGQFVGASSDIVAHSIYAAGIGSATGSISTYGNLHSLGEGGIEALNDVSTAVGSIESAGSIISHNGNVTSGGDLLAGTSLSAGSSIAAAGDVYAYWDITAGGNIVSENGVIQSTEGLIVAGGRIEAAGDITTFFGDIVAVESIKSAGGNIDAFGTLGNGTAAADGSGIHAYGNVMAGSINATGDIVSSTGSIIAYGNGEVIYGYNQKSFAASESSLVISPLDRGGGAGGNITIVNGDLIQAEQMVQAAAIYNHGDSTVTIDAALLDVHRLEGSAGFLLDVDDILVRDGASATVAFSSQVKNLTLANSYGSLMFAGDLGSAGGPLESISTEGALIGGETSAVFTDLLAGSGSLTADSVVVERSEIYALNTQSLAVGDGGIGWAGLSGPHQINHSGPNPIVSSGGIQMNHVVPDGAAGALNLTSTDASVIFGADHINGANLNGGMGDSGHGGELAVTAPDIEVRAGTAINANSASATASGGGIHFISTSTTKPVGITVADTAQINALLAASGQGSGGRIYFTANNGIDVAGNLNAGTTSNATGSRIDISNTSNVYPINLFGTSNLNADIINVAALGQQGILNIHAGARLSATRQIQLFGGTFTGGEVRFTGNGVVTLQSPNILIHANTVQVDSSVRVDNFGATHVQTQNANFLSPTEGVGPNGTGGFRNPVNVTPLALQQ